MEIVAFLDDSHHAHIIGFISCSQFSHAKPIHFIVDSGSSTTTLLGDDVTRLGINCAGLQPAPVPCLTASGTTVTPYVLPDVDLLFTLRQRWFERRPDVTTFHFASLHCNPPPTQPVFIPEEGYLQTCSLLGMDFLSIFKTWAFKRRELILRT